MLIREGRRLLRHLSKRGGPAAAIRSRKVTNRLVLSRGLSLVRVLMQITLMLWTINSHNPNLILDLVNNFLDLTISYMTIDAFIQKARSTPSQRYGPAGVAESAPPAGAAKTGPIRSLTRHFVKARGGATATLEAKSRELPTSNLEMPLMAENGRR